MPLLTHSGALGKVRNIQKPKNSLREMCRERLEGVATGSMIR